MVIGKRIPIRVAGTSRRVDALKIKEFGFSNLKYNYRKTKK